MTDDEKKNNHVERRLDNLETKFEAFMRSHEDFKQEMRDRDNQRAEDIRELRQRQDAMQAKHDAEMREMNQRFYDKFDDMNKKIDSKFEIISNQIHNLTVAAVVGFGAIVVALGSIIFSAVK